MFDPAIRFTTERNMSDEFWLSYMESKYKTAQRLGPIDIAEIGVRSGQAAKAMMMACPHARYTGFDILSPSSRPIEWAKHLLEPYDATIVQLDTQSVQDLPQLKATVDLFHVDGAHYEEFCFKDIKLARKVLSLYGVILCDDFDGAGVAAAVARCGMEVEQVGRRECLLRERT